MPSAEQESWWQTGAPDEPVPYLPGLSWWEMGSHQPVQVGNHTQFQWGLFGASFQGRSLGKYMWFAEFNPGFWHNRLKEASDPQPVLGLRLLLLRSLPLWYAASYCPMSHRPPSELQSLRPRCCDSGPVQWSSLFSSRGYSIYGLGI